MWQFPQVFLCADDYALHEGASQGICALLEKGRLSGTSAMVNMPRWERDAPLLKPYAAQGAQIGLHLNLTEGAPLTHVPSLAQDGQFRSLNDQLKAVLKGQLKPKEIATEITAQIQKFVDVWGTMPSFIDGHQHMHALPIIRMELFTVIDEFVERYSNFLPLDGGGTPRSGGEGVNDSHDNDHHPLSHAPHDSSPIKGERGSYMLPWIRIPTDTHAAIFSRPEIVKAEMVRLFASGMDVQADAHNVPYNIGFSGFSPFTYAAQEQYRSLFLKCLNKLGPRPLIMCHPSAPCSVDDAILPARKAEFGYLMGDAFEGDLAKMGMKLLS